ncbi:putative leucine-rich repeat-containing protein DDB_G0290503 isoform X2 [Prorops nasuta]|uniref:putative leucine-rich repeat-containing protein DDB_G0290503 isoform X2 n=1 Tax=Prorops nasuta TaxID=863751 RepID=UPI0034CDEFDC
MSPGNNDGPRNTGTLPKSNRRSDRNRERSAAFQQVQTIRSYHGHAQHSNNLLQLDLQPVSERDYIRAAKNSNNRPISSAPSSYYQDLSDFALPNSRQYNCTREDSITWQKMGPPSDRTQSPQRVAGTKPTNVDRMASYSHPENDLEVLLNSMKTIHDLYLSQQPDKAQTENQLSQIREYIRMTKTMMDSLDINSEPYKKLNKMVEDLQESERELMKILELYHNQKMPTENDENSEMEENGDTSREAQLRQKLRESQRKLVQLKEHQSYLHRMQTRVKERLLEARKAQSALRQQTSAPSLLDNHNVEQLESETAALRGKVAQLQSKKDRMDYLISELQAVELFDKGSCSSEGSQNHIRDKHAELDALKEQLAHLKALMAEATKGRECADSTSEPDLEMNGEHLNGIESNEDQVHHILDNSFERQSDGDESPLVKTKKPSDRPTIEDIQAVTLELKEQSVLLQAARAELLRLKQPSTSFNSNSIPTMVPTSTPPRSYTPSSSEKKQSNSTSEDAQQMQLKRRQLEEFMRKEQSQLSGVNRDATGADWNSQRGSNMHLSHNGTPANSWPQPTALGGSNEPSIDGVSTSENLLDIGPQVAIDNNFPGNWLGYPAPSFPNFQQGSTEYYRQLVIGSQAQQLQMMGTTLQQCCQLLWAQQRELQSMRAAMNHLQLQIRQSQIPQRTSNAENSEDNSNLSRNSHGLGDTIETMLPPSASLPNLVSLPNSSPTISYIPVTTSASSQQHQQQLNNQVPPGNRANNYWDNFRSYSRQNLLSANAKTITDAGQSAIGSSVSAPNATSGGVNSSLMKDKRNREQSIDNTPVLPLTGAEAQYSLNLQLQPSNLQQQERENTVARSNILTNDATQQQDNIWEEENPFYRWLPSSVNDDNNYRTLKLHHLHPELSDVLISLISANRSDQNYLIPILREIETISEDSRLRPSLLRSLYDLQASQPPSSALNEVTDQTASESCQSSDDDSDVGSMLHVELENQAPNSLSDLGANAAGPLFASPQPVVDHFEAFFRDRAIVSNFISSKSEHNEDLAEADQSRPESSQNQQNSTKDKSSEEAILLPPTLSQHNTEMQLDIDGATAEAEEDRAENSCTG